jgi:hypothetical protein
MASSPILVDGADYKESASESPDPILAGVD